MLFRHYPAPPDLAPWVECAWILQGGLPPEGQTILPDGRVELIFHFGDRPARDGGRQPGSLIAGQLREALVLQGEGCMNAAGVRLHPAAAGCAGPAILLAGRIEDLESVHSHWARRAREAAGNAASEQSRVDTLFAFVRELLQGKSEPDAAIVDSTKRMEAAYGRGPMEGFLPVGLRLRQWERRFAASTGLSPKSFARIVRLQRVVALYESGQWRRWADLALESGFYDQAHLANDFRAFSGRSPEAFFREGRGMVEFYRDGFFQDAARRGR